MSALPDKLRENAVTLQVERPRPSDVILVATVRNDSKLEAITLKTSAGQVCVQFQIRLVPTSTGTNVWTAGPKTADSNYTTYTDMDVIDIDADYYLFAILSSPSNCGELFARVKLRTK